MSIVTDVKLLKQVSIPVSNLDEGREIGNKLIEELKNKMNAQQ